MGFIFVFDFQKQGRTKELRLASSACSFAFSSLIAGITGMNHQVWKEIVLMGRG